MKTANVFIEFDGYARLKSIATWQLENYLRRKNCGCN